MRIHLTLSLIARALIPLVILSASPLQVYAISQSDRHAVDYNTIYYDPNAECADTSGGFSAVPGKIASTVGNGLPKSVQTKMQQIFVAGADKFNVDPNFLAAFYYAENGRVDDSTNNGDSATPPPVTGDGKWREPPPPYGSGDPWAVGGNNGTTWPDGSQGAHGPFQFEPGTWQSNKVDGNGDGKADALDMVDAAYGAAKYLAAGGGKIGASEDKLRRAAWAYNHDNDYVNSVITAYKYFSKSTQEDIAGGGATPNPNADTPADPGATAPNNKVYIVGDSILEGAENYGNLSTKLKEKSFEPTIDSSVSRSITHGGTTGNRLSGAATVDSHVDDIKAAGSVIIELGTNSSGSGNEFESQAGDLVDAIKHDHPKNDVNIYWVNIMSDVPQKNEYNQALENVAVAKKITIINALGGNIELSSSDHIHPTAKGAGDYSTLLTGALLSGQNSPNAQATACGEVRASSSGSAGEVSGTRAELNKRLLDNPLLKLGNYGSATSQRSDIENGVISDGLVKLMIAIMEQKHVALKVNALKSDHGIDGMGGHNPGGVAIDIGYYPYEATGKDLYRWLYHNYKELDIRQMIFNMPPDGLQCIGNVSDDLSIRQSHPVDCAGFYKSALAAHNTHIHVGVFADK